MKQGFTLVELILVLAIIGLMVGIGVANFRDFGKRQIVGNISRQIVGDLQGAAADAAAGRRLSGCTGEYLGDRVTFPIDGSGRATSYTVYSACSTTSSSIKTVTLPANAFLTFNVSGVGSVNLLFKPLQLGTDAPGSGFIITVSHSQAAEQSVVTVLQTAEIH